MRKYAPYLVAIFVFVLVISAQFAIWASADAIHPPRWSGAAFKVISFPMFMVVPDSVASLYFWELLLLNSVVWAVVAALGTRILLRSRIQ